MAGFFAGVTFQNMFTYKSTWITILVGLLPIFVPIFLPIIEQWIGIDLPDDAIMAILTKILEILIPSAVGLGVSMYGLNAYKAASLARSEAMAKVAEFESRSSTATAA